ncbi:MAG: thiamine diphosphokinase [Sporomusaceae bacterium]|nr:thiamine diphosphokinase [Sporomusaceae bacterium]
MSVLDLPQVRCTFSRTLPKHQLLIVAGGRKPDKNWLKQVAPKFSVWAVDSGVDSCRNSGVQPERLIGDGDSATEAGWCWATKLAIPIEVHPPEKDLTDLQLALQRAKQLNSGYAVLLTGGWGGRFDHAFSNVYSLQGFKEQGLCTLGIADEQEVLLLLSGGETVSLEFAENPSVISLLPLASICKDVSIAGVHWPLTEVLLKNSLPYAISNRSQARDDTENLVEVSLGEGALGVYLNWERKEGKY